MSVTVVRDGIFGDCENGRDVCPSVFFKSQLPKNYIDKEVRIKFGTHNRGKQGTKN